MFYCSVLYFLTLLCFVFPKQTDDDDEVGPKCITYLLTEETKWEYLLITWDGCTVVKIC